MSEFEQVDDEVVTFKKSDADFMSKCFKHLKQENEALKEENELLRLQLEPQSVGQALDIDLSDFTEIIN